MPFKLLKNDRVRFQLDEFLARPLVVHVASASDQGARNSVFWYLWEDDAVWMILEEGYNTIPVRVREDPRVALGVVDFDPRTGFLQHVSIRGRASLEPWDDDRAGRLLDRYYARLEGYRGRPHRPGAKTQGTLPMTFLRVDPESVLMRELGYRDFVVARSSIRSSQSRTSSRARPGRSPHRS